MYCTFNRDLAPPQNASQWLEEKGAEPGGVLYQNRLQKKKEDIKHLSNQNQNPLLMKCIVRSYISLHPLKKQTATTTTFTPLRLTEPWNGSPCGWFELRIILKGSGWDHLVRFDQEECIDYPHTLDIYIFYTRAKQTLLCEQQIWNTHPESTVIRMNKLYSISKYSLKVQTGRHVPKTALRPDRRIPRSAFRCHASDGPLWKLDWKRDGNWFIYNAKTIIQARSRGERTREQSHVTGIPKCTEV